MSDRLIRFTHKVRDLEPGETMLSQELYELPPLTTQAIIEVLKAELQGADVILLHVGLRVVVETAQGDTNAGIGVEYKTGK